MKDWLALPEITQQMAADLIGCTQGAISQMVKAEREIYITIEDDRAVSYHERKKPGRKSAA